MIHRLTLIVLLSLTLPSLAQPLQRGHVFLETNFDSPDPLRGWSGAGQIAEGVANTKALLVQRPANAAPGTAVSVIPLPAEQMRGCTIYGYATVRAQNVSDKPQPWNGIKVMAIVDSPSGKSWPQATVGVGTFDWKRLAFSAHIPADATAVSLCLGLEQVTGSVWFDDIRIVLGKPPATTQPSPTTGPAHRGHNLPRLRGAMIAPRIDEAGLRTLGQDWNANLIRWQLIRTGQPNQSHTGAEYDRWLQEELRRLDQALPLCKKYGLYVVVDLHSPPGGRATSGGYIGSDNGLFTDKACQDQFVQTWQHIAQRYKNEKIIWGFDLVNEPVEGVIGEGCDDWHDLAERAAKAILAIDPQRTLIVEPADWGGPDAMRNLQPLNVPNVVYSAHMYVPGAFTHQGVFDKTKVFRYPGTIEGKYWDKAQLEAALKPVIDFQKTHNVAIYIGEFSAIRWAPDGSAYRYLNDVIDIFESHGWDWSYHAFREWQGWSVEHTEDPANPRPATQPTQRQQLLQRWFSQNRKPQ